jgi:hypothetical protein
LKLETTEMSPLLRADNGCSLLEGRKNANE